jgi:hypothetical protein
MLSSLHEEWTNDQWVGVERATWSYDTHSKQLSNLHEVWVNGHWEILERYSYTYTANGQMLTEIHETWSTTPNEKWRSTTCTYDAIGNVIAELRERWLNGQRDTLSIVYDYRFNRVGNMLSFTSQSWQTDRWINLLRDSATFDNNGHMVSCLAQIGDVDRWINSTLRTYSFDANNNLISLWRYEWGIDSSWSPLRDDFGRPKPLYYWGPPLYPRKETYTEYYNAYNIDYSYTTITPTGSIPGPGTIPAGFALSQNYPNPFNPKTGVRFQVAGVSDVKITVYDVLGREVAVLVNERKQPGSYEVSFDGSALASGVYVYRLMAGQYVESRKMVLMK